MTDTQALLSELARVKVLFQARALATIIHGSPNASASRVSPGVTPGARPSLTGASATLSEPQP